MALSLKRFPGSLDHFTSTPFSRQTLEKVVYNLGLDYLLECFLPPCTCTFGRIMCALPKTILELGRGGGGGVGGGLHAPARTPMG